MSERKVPTHEVTYTHLRDMVLTGGLAPGQAVTIQGLIRDLGERHRIDLRGRRGQEPHAPLRREDLRSLLASPG